MGKLSLDKGGSGENKLFKDNYSSSNGLPSGGGGSNQDDGSGLGCLLKILGIILGGIVALARGDCDSDFDSRSSYDPSRAAREARDFTQQMREFHKARALSDESASPEEKERSQTRFEEFERAPGVELPPLDLASWNGRDAVEPGRRGLITVNGAEFPFRYCPSGSIGAKRAYSQDKKDELNLSVSEGFWLLETETTLEMATALLENHPALSEDEKLKPAVPLSARTFSGFIAVLNDRSLAPKGWKFAVPSDEMWEYAYWAGNDKDHNRGNAGKERRGALLPVGSYDANEWGFRDMYGNVAEFCYRGVKEFGLVNSTRDVALGGDWEYSREVYDPFPRDVTRDSMEEVELGATGLRLAIVKENVKTGEPKTGVRFGSPFADFAKSRDSIVPEISPGVDMPDLDPSEIDKGEPEPGRKLVLTIDGVEFPFRRCPKGRLERKELFLPVEKLGEQHWEQQGNFGSIVSGFKVRDVNLETTEDYWTLETETTREMWNLVFEKEESLSETSKRLPISGVTYEQAEQFVEKLNEKGVAPSGWRFAIPTQSQWELACRAGSNTRLYWGDEDESEIEEREIGDDEELSQEDRDSIAELRKKIDNEKSKNQRLIKMMERRLELAKKAREKNPDVQIDKYTPEELERIIERIKSENSVLSSDEEPKPIEELKTGADLSDAERKWAKRDRAERARDKRRETRNQEAAKKVNAYVTYELRREEATPVGSFEPNQWGLRDMLGNVQEWVDFDEPNRPLFERPRRGGSWKTLLSNLDAVSEFKTYVCSEIEDLGFRIVLVRDKNAQISGKH
ncbi:MAG: SUMF1/EgtB/PvdO family nonheme iron enzyme [Thermoguttaceae bacterium]|nr:SUMF1/EgtB/PvdO family nonheme iron enzyme [Thermoguttaceae bacterium]